MNAENADQTPSSIALSGVGLRSSAARPLLFAPLLLITLFFPFLRRSTHRAMAIPSSDKRNSVWWCVVSHYAPAQLCAARRGYHSNPAFTRFLSIGISVAVDGDESGKQCGKPSGSRTLTWRSAMGVGDRSNHCPCGGSHVWQISSAFRCHLANRSLGLCLSCLNPFRFQ